ncbi:MAG: restriction endonuclease subunit S [Nostoc sp.]|uniref:restriction endonuclease subunit S n=1 Tax=Nostoc sp. TaxID=1180 RepID=UPI002FF7FB83
MIITRIPLRKIVKQVLRTIDVLPGTSYRTMGVKWWGEGAYERETIDGSQTAAKTLSIVREGDLIINKIWVRHGSIAIAGKDVDGCVASGEFPTFELDLNEVLPMWLHWYTKTREFWDKCAQLSQGTSGKNRIKPDLFLAVEIPLPPLEEQRRVVTRVEELVGKVEEVRSLRQQALEEIQALVASEKNAIFSDEFAEKYSFTTLGEIADVRAGVTLGRKLQGITVNLPYLRVANVQDGYLDLKSIKKLEIYEYEREKWQLQPGDILLTEGGDWDKLGRGTVWQGEIPNCIHQNHIYRLRINLNEFDPYYLSALIASPYGKAYFQTASKQTTNLATINQRQLKAFIVFKPPLPQQRRIVSYLDELQTKVDTMKRMREQVIKELDALLPSILDKAFKGEL